MAEEMRSDAHGELRDCLTVELDPDPTQREGEAMSEFPGRLHQKISLPAPPAKQLEPSSTAR
jgi:hypothetical protein